ncbi:hypothetical protein MKQ70_25175 [Chitinophaga sedimenti]|uniref:hypothetical protein n=1 Tax=Chitinophaga sedimenti TaxID=2033606 RepID=UPI002003E251|nr:hypothetical protein [Chitinophaga sedimenti]MCK7558119.1 hypothetical protein [Chitinophaga sedimenti]
MEQLQEKAPYSNEIPVKVVFQMLIDWYRYFLRNWIIILIGGLVGALVGLSYSILKPTKYAAELTFVLEDSKGPGLGNIMGLASQMGFDLGGGASSGVFSGDNILAFLKSRLIVEEALLSKVNIKGKEQSLADYYLTANGFRDQWKDSRELSTISYNPDVARSSFTFYQDSIMLLIYDRLVKTELNVGKPDKN